MSRVVKSVFCSVIFPRWLETICPFRLFITSLIMWLTKTRESNLQVPETQHSRSFTYIRPNHDSHDRIPLRLLFPPPPTSNVTNVGVNARTTCWNWKQRYAPISWHGWRKGEKEISVKGFLCDIYWLYWFSCRRFLSSYLKGVCTSTVGLLEHVQWACKHGCC